MDPSEATGPYMNAPRAGSVSASTLVQPLPTIRRTTVEDEEDEDEDEDEDDDDLDGLYNLYPLCR